MTTKPTTPQTPARSLAAGRSRTLAAAGFIALAVTLVWCALASAGTYTIENCPSAPTPNGDPGPWVIFGSPQGAKGSCAGGSGDWIGPRGGSMTPGTADGVTVSVPANSGITIREARVWWSVPHQAAGADTFAVALANGTTVGENTTPLEHKASPDSFVLPSSTTTFKLEDYCSNDDAGNPCSFGAGENPNLELYGSQLTLAESGPPKGNTTGGGLTSPNPISGTQSVSYDAEDTGSGVRLAQLHIDGETVATNDYIAQCPYSGFAACPASESDTISWNTAKVTDGTHTVQLTVQDAAQNTAYIYTGSITTHNAPTNSSIPAVLAPSQVVVGASLQAQPGGWSAPSGAGSITYAYQWQDCDTEGNNCRPIPAAQNASYTPAPSDVGHTLRVAVNAADSDGMSSATSNPTATVLASSSSLGAPPGPGGNNPTTNTNTTNTSSGGSSAGVGSLTVGVGAPNGSVASEATVVHLGVPATLSRAYAKRALKLPGRLTNSLGAPIMGANLDVLEQVAGTSSLRLLKHVRTSAAGTFTVAIPAGPSRRIEVAYRAFSGDLAYAATETVRENVAAGAQLHITPRHTGVTGTIKLTGRVSGPLPRHGAIVEILVKYRGRWQPIRNPRTNSHGSFQIAYQFAGGHGRFPFKVEIPAGQTGLPYVTGYSNTVYVTTS